MTIDVTQGAGERLAHRTQRGAPCARALPRELAGIAASLRVRIASSAARPESPSNDAVALGRVVDPPGWSGLRARRGGRRAARAWAVQRDRQRVDHGRLRAAHPFGIGRAELAERLVDDRIACSEERQQPGYAGSTSPWSSTSVSWMRAAKRGRPSPCGLARRLGDRREALAHSHHVTSSPTGGRDLHVEAVDRNRNRRASFVPERSAGRNAPREDREFCRIAAIPYVHGRR